MKTNKYLDKYIKLNADKNRAEKELSEMGWKDKVHDIYVRPSHFTCFQLSINLGCGEKSYSVRTMREMAEYILMITEELDDTSDIIDEIIKMQ